MQSIMTDKIGLIVKNDGEALKAALGLTELRHTGNFIFEGRRKDIIIKIITARVDEDGNEIGITGIYIDPDISIKLLAYYKMIKGKTVTETCFEIPISQKRYTELANMKRGSETYETIRDVLKSFTHLQGYDELGAWHLEFEVYPEEDAQ